MPEPTRGAVMTGTTIAIDCADCALQGTDACGDCLVTFVLGREPDDAVVLDADEARALRSLSRAGLVPRIRHTGCASALGG
ncbi:MAG TPA: hypothetical protein VEI83_01095 [Acidimicrobiales bacterium]|nr:hypothetical protein [Acidimicrobiales bacterium]